MLKAIQFTFHRRSAMIGESISCAAIYCGFYCLKANSPPLLIYRYMAQQSSYYLQRAFLPIKHRLDKEKKCVLPPNHLKLS